MKRWIKTSYLLVAISSLLMNGCSLGGSSTQQNPGAPTSQSQSTNAQPAAKSDHKLKVVATFYPMVEFSRQVAGDHADVIGLIPAGAEPHDWEPTAKDMIQVKEADIFVYNGIVEEWADHALQSTPNDKRIVVRASKGINLMEDIHENGQEKQNGKELDPHVWLDPVLAQKEVAAIEAAFEQADPKHKEDYKKNAEAYLEKLQTLDQEYKSGLQNVKRKDFVTQHAAFGYLSNEYSLNQIPIAGLSPDVEPSLEKMTEIVKLVQERKVKTIFFETLVEPKLAQTVANEVGAKTAVLNPIEGLTDADKKNNLDYIGIMKNNLEALKKALNE